MTKTDDHIHPLALEGEVDPVALARARARALKIYVGAAAGMIVALGGAVGGAVTAYRAAVATAAEKAQAVKQKAEDGYQAQKHAVEELQSRVLVLEQAAQRAQVIEAHQRKGPRAARRPPPLPPAIPVAVTTHPRALPGDLDKAEAQNAKAAPPQGSPRGVEAGAN